MKKLLDRWYDHPLIWDFYDRSFNEMYLNFKEFKQATWEVDVYDGIDGEVIFINDTSDRVPTQIKTSGKISQYNLKVNLAYVNENGDDSGFGLYFNEDRIGNIKLFAFGFPFIGKVLFIDFDAFWVIWEQHFNEWEENFGVVNGLNKYLAVPVGVLLRDIDEYDYRGVTVDRVQRSRLEK